LSNCPLFLGRLPTKRKTRTAHGMNTACPRRLFEQASPVRESGRVIITQLKFVRKPPRSPDGTRMLSGVAYSSHRQLLQAKWFTVSVRTDPDCPDQSSTVGAVKYALPRAGVRMLPQRGRSAAMDRNRPSVCRVLTRLPVSRSSTSDDSGLQRRMWLVPDKSRRYPRQARLAQSRKWRVRRYSELRV
jgi:hypothetical protein